MGNPYRHNSRSRRSPGSTSSRFLNNRESILHIAASWNPRQFNDHVAEYQWIPRQSDVIQHGIGQRWIHDLNSAVKRYSNVRQLEDRNASRFDKQDNSTSLL